MMPASPGDAEGFAGRAGAFFTRFHLIRCLRASQERASATYDESGRKMGDYAEARPGARCAYRAGPPIGDARCALCAHVSGRRHAHASTTIDASDY